MKRNLMNQVERVRKYASNLTTGIAVADAPIQTAASGRSWWTIPLKTRCLGRRSSEDYRLAGTAACSDRCAICFRPQRSEGNNFEVRGGIKKYSDSKISVSCRQHFRRGTDGAGRLGSSRAKDPVRCEASSPHRRFSTTGLRLRRAFLLSVS